jgi:hypothetical protein
MLPPIGLAIGAELIRDGGSLGAQFLGSDGVEYRLFFPIILVDSSPGYHEAKGYSPPVLIDRLAGTSVSLSWERARVLLNQMIPLLRELKHQDVADCMLDVAKSAGSLTPKAIAQFECLRGPKKWLRLGDGSAKA